MRATSADHGTTCSIWSRKTCLRAFFCTEAELEAGLIHGLDCLSQGLRLPYGVGGITAPQFETKYANDPEKQAAASIRQWEELLSVLPSTALTSSTAAKTTLSSAKLVRDYIEDTNTEDIKIYLNHLVEQYDDYERDSRGDEQDISIGKRFPWRPSPVHGGDTVFSLPASIEDQYIAWLYSDPDQITRKRAICLEVTFLAENLERLGVRYS